MDTVQTTNGANVAGLGKYTTKHSSTSQIESENNHWFRLFSSPQSYVKLRIYMIFCLGLIVGGIYQGIGNDATKALFNFGFCFTVTIAFMYIPLMPVLLQFPMEVQLLKREHFNRWFRIGPYYLAMTAAKLPMQIVLAFGYITMIYTMSDQPLEFNRMAMFYSISVLIALTSESLGVLISARLSLIVSCPLFSYKNKRVFQMTLMKQ